MSFIINPFVFATAPALTTPQVEFDGRNLSGSDGSNITLWSDSSGNGRDATNGIGGVNGPVLKTAILNGNNIARWDGNVRGLIFSGNAAAASITCIAVVKCTDSNTRAILAESTGGGGSPRFNIDANKINLWEDDNVNIGSSTTSLNTTSFYTVAVTFNGTNYAFYLNGSADGTGSHAATFSLRFSRIGLRSGNQDRFLGDIAYIAYWNSILGSTELTTRFGDLRTVWAHY